MNRKGEVFRNGIPAGILEETDSGYHFRYHDSYLAVPENASISLTIPRAQQLHESSDLFPFFHGLLAEGNLKELQCRQMQIDEDDHFGRLIKTAGQDVIGNVTIRDMDV
jgi:serine/threonine-protein kinase HipA